MHADDYVGHAPARARQIAATITALLDAQANPT